MSTTTPRDSTLEISGTWNARDVGGRAVPSGAGEPLRAGVLYRTASLSGLDASGRDALMSRGVRLVLDLRGPDEVQRDGHDAVGPDVEVRDRAMDPAAALSGTAQDVDGGSSADTAALFRRLVDAPDPAAVARQMMVGVYDSFVTNAGIRGVVGEVLSDIAGADGPVVVHCSAGKDRTGWVVALVQYVCGVDAGDRMSEYLTSAAAAPIMAASVPPVPGLPADALAPLWSVEPQYLSGAWDLAIEAFGSIDGYLTACGAGAVIQDRLRARFGV